MDWLKANASKTLKMGTQRMENIFISKNAILKISVLSLFIFSANCYSQDLSAVSIVPGIYTVKTEILMPHLRENLRYTNTQTTQCLGQQDALSIFPILSEASFLGCALVQSRKNAKKMEFNLVCSNPTAASGSAQFVIDKAFFRAILNVKMGGKNMKFTQQVSGQRTGACK